MANTSYNERLKLKAMFCNNIGVGFVVGGFFVPLVATFPSRDQILEWIHGIGNGTIDLLDPHVSYKITGVFISMILPIAFGLAMSVWGENFLSRLED